MDLFKPIVPENERHPNFVRLLNVATPEEMDVLLEWSSGFVDRDGKFIKEFQTTFNSSFWELYLFAVIKELKLSVDFTHPSPDFVISGPNTTFSAEAVIASHAEGHRPEWEREIDPDTLQSINVAEILYLASIRLSNALVSKARKYQDTYAKLAHVTDRPFVVCVAPFEQPFFFAQNDHALRRVLYGYDQPLVIENPNTGKRILVGEALMEEVTKTSGAKIPLALFSRPGMESLSAVIFSNTATYCKVQALRRENDLRVRFFATRYRAAAMHPTEIEAWKEDYKETLLDGLHICLNPFASRPLDLAPFQGREMAIHRFDPSNGEYDVRSPDGFLIQRSCMSFRGATELPVPAEGKPAVYKQVQRKPWPEGSLVAALAEVPPFTQNHIAHYQGWTVVVAFDEIDREWMAQSLKGTFFSVPEYMAGMAADDDRGYFVAIGSFASKEAALAEAIREINGRTQAT